MFFFRFSISGHSDTACQINSTELQNGLLLLPLLLFLGLSPPVKQEHLLLSMSCIFLLGEWVVLTETSTIKLYRRETNSALRKIQQTVVLHSVKIMFFPLLTLPLSS